MNRKRIFRSLRLLLLAAPCLTLASCFGLSAIHVQSKEHPQFQIAQLKPESWTSGRSIKDTKGTPKNPTREQVAAIWGQPQSKRHSGDTEVWSYRDSNLAFTGLMPMVGIGVPLMIPTGNEGCDIHFASGGGPATKAVERTTTQDGAALLLISGEGKDNKAGFHRIDSL